MKKHIHTIEVEKFNPNDEEYKVVGISKKIGHNVKLNECIAVLESSKAIIEIESPVNGKILSIDIKVNDFVTVGQSIIKLESGEVINSAEQSEKSHKIKIDETQSIDDNQFDLSISNTLRSKFDKYRNTFLEDATENDEINSVYKKNYIANHNINHGKNCFVGFGSNLNNVVLGEQVWINRNSTIFSNNKTNIIQIGSGSYIGPYNWIEGSFGIQIGECVHIAGPSTCLYTHSGMKIALQGELAGNPSIPNRKSKNNYFSPISIGNNIWIGPNCTIFPGTIINDYVVVLPNSLVKAQNIPSYTLVKNDGTVEYNSSFVKSLTKN